MKPSDLKYVLTENLKDNPNQSIFIWGGVGIGKSSIVHQITQDLNWGLTDLRLLLLDPTDLRGIPAIKGDKAVWLPPTFLPDQETDEPGILFLDELNAAPLSVQAAAYQLILNRRVGEYKVPKNWRIIAAGNRMQDRAVVHKMPTPLSNRFIHYTLDPDFDDWKTWAHNYNIDPQVIGFLNFRNELLFKFDASKDSNSFPTPRSWEFVSNVMKTQIHGNRLRDTVIGCVGKGAASEFMSFLKIYRDLPNPEDILMHDKNIIPKEMSQLYALTSALVGLCKRNPDKVGRLIDYSLKLNPEFAVLMIKDALRSKELKSPILKHDKWNLFVETYKEAII